MPETVRARFAPSPTGPPHIGSIWQALMTWLYTRHAGGKFIVRIEDTDRARFVPEAEANMLEALYWCGLAYDEGPNSGGSYGPYRQSERLPIYQEHVTKLIAAGAAYYCFCSQERLEELRRSQQLLGQAPGYDGRCRDLPGAAVADRLAQGETAVVRLRFEKKGETTFTDLIRGEVTFQNRLIDDQVLMKSDGWPTYHLAAVVDDHLMEIGPLVIRAEEWLPSTPKHLALYKVFGWQAPQFAHLPLILGPDRSKLSKRHGSTNALDFRRQGYLPEAMVNFLALLGWNPKTTQEFLSRSELIAQFNITNMNKAGAIFDDRKLAWMNGQYLRRLAVEDFTTSALAYLAREREYREEGDYYLRPSGKIRTEVLRAALRVLQHRVNRLSELENAIDEFFVIPEYPVALLCWKNLPLEVNPQTSTEQRLVWLIEFLAQHSEASFNEVDLETAIKDALKDQKIPTGEVLWPMRVALAGRPQSPGPFTIASVVGKTETLRRLETARAKLSSSHAQ